MRHIEALSEHDMFAAFLKGEIVSKRFGSVILALLQRAGHAADWFNHQPA